MCPQKNSKEGYPLMKILFLTFWILMVSKVYLQIGKYLYDYIT